MQVARIDLSEKQVAFVAAILDGAKPCDAAKAAGYESPAAQWHLMRTPAVALAIRAEVSRRLATEGAPLAYRVLLDIVRDKQVNPGVRRQAARDLLDRAGYVPPKPEESAAPDDKRALSDRSTDDLQELIGKLERELGERARPLNAQAESVQSGNGLEYLD